MAENNVNTTVVETPEMEKRFHDEYTVKMIRSGRLTTLIAALLTFLPPIIGGLLWPNGFLYAIGYAGLAATIWAAIVPALLARKSRKRFGSPKFRVWGGKPMIALILVFGIGNAVIHILSSFNLLPVYQ